MELALAQARVIAAERHAEKQEEEATPCSHLVLTRLGHAKIRRVSSQAMEAAVNAEALLQELEREQAKAEEIKRRKANHHLLCIIAHSLPPLV